MPIVYDPNNTGIVIEVGEDLGYEYPLRLDLTPGSDDHQRLLQYVMNRGRDSQAVMRGRYDSYKKADQLMNAYLPEDVETVENLGDNEDIRPIVPMGFALVDTLLANLVSTFTGDAFFKLRGVGPEDRVKAMLAELVLDLQFQRSQALLNLHTQWRDMFVYGIGVVSPSWHEEFGRKIVMREGGAYASSLGDFLSNGTKVRSLEYGKVWEGNRLDNWSIYGYLPDPNRPAQDVQKMHFVGCVEKSDLYELLELEENEPDTYFNVKYLQDQGEMKSELLESGEWTQTIRDSNDRSETSKRIDVVNMYCKLIPKTMGLGDHEYPEIWLFTVAGDRVIIRAQPVDYAHNEYPVAVAAPTYDGYSTAPTSLMELMSGMLESLDWYFRSHFYEVRKTLHNMFVLDPFLINYSQVINPGPGKAICMREHVWGRGVKDAIQQLQTTDHTRNHMADAALTLDLAQRISGAVTQMQGVMETKGERRSATESRDTRLAALGRIGKQALVCSLQSNIRIGRQFVYNMQQFMQTPMFVELTGRNQMELQAIYEGEKGKMVGPEDLIGDIDIIVQDPAGEGGEYLNEMLQMYTLIQSGQETAMNFDSVRMMLDLMRMAGKKNPAQFLRDEFSPRFVADEEVLEGVESGQLKAVGGSGARGAAGTDAGRQSDEAAQAQERSPGGGTSNSGIYGLPDTVRNAVNGAG